MKTSELIDTKAQKKREQLLLEGLNSGKATPMTKDDWETIKQRGIERINQKKQQRELEGLLLDGINGGEAMPMTDQDWDDIRAEVKRRANAG